MFTHYNHKTEIHIRDATVMGKKKKKKPYMENEYGKRAREKQKRESCQHQVINMERDTAPT